jgi:hypothetical protein
MTRQIKELFFKYLQSNLLRCVVIWTAKIINETLKLLRFFSIWDFYLGPPLIRNRPTSLWVQKFNSKSKTKAIYKKIEAPNAKKIFSAEERKKIHPNLIKYAEEKQYEQFVASIPAGKIIGSYTNITPDHRILRDSAGYLGENTYSNIYTYYPYLGRSAKKKWNIAVISGNDTHKNYNHRMTFALPKVYLFEKSGLKIDKYVTDCSTHFHKESLEALWIHKEKILIADPKEYFQADNLMIASTTTVHGNLPKRAIDFLQHTFLTDSKWKKTDLKLFIERKTTRKIKNQSEVRGFLEKKGFKKVVLDTMSIKEQADLFQRAQIIVSPHGAWLTNLVFCQPWTKVIELFHEKTVFWHYFCLSQSCNLDYSYLVWKIDNTQTHIIQMDRDMDIPMDKLRNTLNLKDW